MSLFQRTRASFFSRLARREVVVVEGYTSGGTAEAQDFTLSRRSHDGFRSQVFAFATQPERFTPRYNAWSLGFGGRT